MDDKLEKLMVGQTKTNWEPDFFQKDLESFINKTQQQFLTPKKSDDLNSVRTPSSVVTRVTETKKLHSLSFTTPAKATPTRRASDPNDNNGLPEPPETGTYVLGSVDGTLEWIETEECGGDPQEYTP